MRNYLARRATSDCAVVLIGLEADGALDRNARRMCEECVRVGISAYRVDYHEIDRIPSLTSQPEILVMPFFPHRFWDLNCEVPDDTGLYGTSMLSYTRFRDFCLDAEARLARALAGRKVAYLVPLEKAFEDRDKVSTVRTLAAAGVPTPPGIASRVSAEVLGRIEPDRGVFIKCRFGAEGKGITYLSANGWWTNYRVEGGKLGNYGIHDPWPFKPITGKTNLLAQLLEHEVIVEQEIVTPQLEPGAKFDVRAYVSAGVSPHMIVRINRRDAFVTNVSQGARTVHRFAEILTPRTISRVQRTALAAARALECPFVGIDLMFDRNGGVAVVETQVFTDFPDYRFFNLPEFVARQIRSGAWRARFWNRGGRQNRPVK